MLLIVFEVLFSTCKLDWNLNFRFLQYLTTTLQTIISKLSPHLSDLKSLKTKTALFPKAMQANVGQLDINFREITTTAYVQTTFGLATVWATQKYHQRRSGGKTGKSLRGLPPALTPLKWLQACHLEIPTGCPQYSKTTIKHAPVIHHYLSFVSIEMLLLKHVITWAT